MKSNLHVESIPEKGSDFFFEIDFPSEMHPGMKPRNYLSGIQSVLIIEDNQRAGEILKGYFLQEGIRAIWVRNGLGAFEALKANPNINLMLIDSEMPLMNGIQTLAMLKNEVNLGGIHTFLYCSKVEEDLRENANYLDAKLLEIKPIFKTSLFQSIHRHLKKEVTTESKPVHSGKGSLMKYEGRILIVDDNENNLLLMTSLLEYLLPDSEIFTSENGKDAIEKYRANKPDIIFMDIQMPIMDGIEATKLLKEKYFSTKHVPIIAITAGSIKGERERCLGLGMDDFLNKPIVQEEFIKVLKKWLSTSKPNLSSLRKLTETGTSHQHFNFSELSQNLFHNQPLIETLIKRTMDEIEFYIRDCQKFIELKDLVSLKKRTHKLKGSASNVFFEVLSGKLNRIEHLKEEDFSQYIDLLKEIEEEFSILVQIDLDRIFKKNGVRVR